MAKSVAQSQFDTEDDGDGYVDDDGVQKYDEVSPHHAQHINRIGQLDLLDDAAAVGERDTAVVDRGRHEAPDDIADREVRHVMLEFHMEQAAVDDAEQQDEDARAQRDPERAEHRAAIALADVVPTHDAPDPPDAESGHDLFGDRACDPGLEIEVRLRHEIDGGSRRCRHRGRIFDLRQHFGNDDLQKLKLGSGVARPDWRRRHTGYLPEPKAQSEANTAHRQHRPQQREQRRRPQPIP